MTFRRARARDLAALDELLARCTIRTTSLRFNVPMPRLPRAYADAIARSEGVHVVAEVDGSIVALASCVDGELAVLVEDAWQGLGIGTRLLDEVVARTALPELTADVSYGNPRALRMLKRLGRTHVSAGPDGYRLVMQLAKIHLCSTAPTTRRTARSPALSRS
jgi:GNAT superfamily N-acetyltransferase